MPDKTLHNQMTLMLDICSTYFKSDNERGQFFHFRKSQNNPGGCTNILKIISLPFCFKNECGEYFFSIGSKMAK